MKPLEKQLFRNLYFSLQLPVLWRVRAMVYRNVENPVYDLTWEQIGKQVLSEIDNND